MTLFLEKIWPYLLTIVFTAFWMKCLNSIFPKEISSLMSASGTVSAVLIGFLGTSKAIMLGLSGSKIAVQISSTGYQGLLFGYMRQATYFSVILLIVSVVGFFMPMDFYGHLQGSSRDYFPAVWIAVAVCSISLYVRIIHLLFKVLEVNFSK